MQRAIYYNTKDGASALILRLLMILLNNDDDMIHYAFMLLRFGADTCH